MNEFIYLVLMLRRPSQMVRVHTKTISTKMSSLPSFFRWLSWTKKSLCILPFVISISMRVHCERPFKTFFSIEFSSHLYELLDYV